MKRQIAVILAGGRGTRMNSDVPKQYMLIEDKPLLYYTIKAFEDSFIDSYVVVCGADDVEFVKNQIINLYGFKKCFMVVTGGKNRYDSVFSGLKAIDTDTNNKECIVYIHDGARPCVTEEILKRCKIDVEKYHASVAAVKVKDTIKVIDEDGFTITTPDRSMLWQMQTPQVFDFELIYDAYKALYKDDNPGNITDDAMVLERYTQTQVHMCESEYCNIKVTTPEDLDIVKMFLHR